MRSPRLVQIDGERFEDLGEQEFELLYALYEKRGQVCRKDDLIEAIYYRQYHDVGTSVADARLYTLVRRLRRRIEPDPKNPQYIRTVRNEGYRFVTGADTESDRDGP